MPTASTQPIAHLSEDSRNKHLLALNALVSYLSTIKSKPLDEVQFCGKHEMEPDFFLALRDLEALEYDFVRSGEATTWYKSTAKLMAVTPEEVCSEMMGTPVAPRETAATVAGGYAERMEAAKEELVIEFFTAADNAGAVDTDDEEPEDEVVKDFKRKVKESMSVPDVAASFAKEAIRQNGEVSQLKEVRELIADIRKTLSKPIAVETDLNKYPMPYPSVDDIIGKAADMKPVALSRPYQIQLDYEDTSIKMNVRTTEDSDFVDAILYKLHRV